MPESKDQSKLEKFYIEAKEDFSLSQINLSDKVKLAPGIKNKWIYRIVKEEKLLSKMRALQQEMVASLAQYTRKVKPSAIKSNTETLKQEDLELLNNEIKDQEEAIRFLHLLLDNQLKSFTWDLKNAIEYAKLENL